MTASIGSHDDFPLEASVPKDAVPLESILCTEELRRRRLRPPDHERENRALVALAGALADSRSNIILQTLADAILDVTDCDSSGLSLLTKDDGGKRFYWPAIAGAWSPHVGSGTPRDFGPCGDVLDCDRTLLFRRFERRYPYFLAIMPVAEECLLVPFYVAGKAVGTIWAIMHSDRRKFDAEDERIMNALGQFASLAYQTLDTIEELKLQIAARQKAEAEMRELASGLQVKMRRFVDANIMGIFIWTLDGQIVEANDTFLRMVDYDRAALVAGLLRWTDLTPAEWRAADDQRVVELKATGGAQPYEKEFLRKGGDRVPVLVGGALFEAGGSEGVAFVVDLTDRKRAEAEVREAHLELAHANRLAAIGQLSASIGHEVNQPLSGVVTNAETGLLWLKTEPPNVREAIGAFSRVVRDGKRAGEVVNRVRALIKKAPPRRDSVEINEAIQEVIALTHSEAVKNGVSVRTELAETVPVVEGDRVQLQQVMLNLIMNAVEAMIGPGGGPRELLIGTAPAPDGVHVAVQDSGPGLSPDTLERVFEEFYTTKTGGLGMGLSISRSIVEAHGGRLWAGPCAPRGAMFNFTLPAHPR